MLRNVHLAVSLNCPPDHVGTSSRRLTSVRRRPPRRPMPRCGRRASRSGLALPYDFCPAQQPDASPRHSLLFAVITSLLYPDLCSPLHFLPLVRSSRSHSTPCTETDLVVHRTCRSFKCHCSVPLGLKGCKDRYNVQRRHCVRLKNKSKGLDITFSGSTDIKDIMIKRKLKSLTCGAAFMFLRFGRLKWGSGYSKRASGLGDVRQ